MCPPRRQSTHLSPRQPGQSARFPPETLCLPRHCGRLQGARRLSVRKNGRADLAPDPSSRLVACSGPDKLEPFSHLRVCTALLWTPLSGAHVVGSTRACAALHESLAAVNGESTDVGDAILCEKFCAPHRLLPHDHCGPRSATCPFSLTELRQTQARLILLKVDRV